jgi:hypothetical protein
MPVDHVTCELPIPDGREMVKDSFQIESLWCRMDLFTITAAGSRSLNLLSSGTTDQAIVADILGSSEAFGKRVRNASAVLDLVLRLLHPSAKRLGIRASFAQDTLTLPNEDPVPPRTPTPPPVRVLSGLRLTVIARLPFT